MVAIFCRQKPMKRDNITELGSLTGMIRYPKIIEARWWCLIKWSQVNPMIIMSRDMKLAVIKAWPTELWRCLPEHGVPKSRIHGQSKKILLYMKHKINPRWVIRRQQAASLINWHNPSLCFQTWTRTHLREGWLSIRKDSGTLYSKHTQ